tara:strand:+ start:255 stop:404 length:150 start_codon:yes stop_codon:yes gene_type:complete
VRDTVIGVTGTLASFGLSELNLVCGILAGLSTTVYMVVAIFRKREDIEK